MTHEEKLYEQKLKAILGDQKFSLGPNSYTPGAYLLSIYCKTHLRHVDISVTSADLSLPEAEMKIRFIDPALNALSRRNAPKRAA